MPFIKLYTLAVLHFATMLFLATDAAAYGTPVVSHSRKIPLTKLNAWTLPKPTNKHPFDIFKPSSFSASWYDDHNPTARKVIYNDFDQDELYHFVVSFKSDDWIDPPHEVVPQTSKDKTRRPLKVFASSVYKRFRNLIH